MPTAGRSAGSATRRAGVRRSAPDRRLVSAGSIIGIGLVCFALWLLLDGRQLYNSAAGAPLGVRRDVAMDLLRPVARIDEALSLDRIVNGANRALGRAGGPGSGYSGGATGTLVTVPVEKSVTTRPARGRGLAAQGDQRGSTSPGASTPGGQGEGPPTTLLGASPGSEPAPPARAGTGPAPGLVPLGLSQPTAARPITVLEIGDSLGEDLGNGLTDVLGTHGDVILKAAAVGNTGLADVAYYDWPVNLEKDLAADHPSVVIAMFGGNDSQAFAVGSRNAEPGTAFFRAAYGDRVGKIMEEATAAGARVLWVGMPVMQSASFSSRMAELNSVYRAEAAGHRGVSYYSCWTLFENASYQYSTYLPDASGNLVVARDPDGVHIAPPAGEDLLANAVVKVMDRTYRIHL